MNCLTFTRQAKVLFGCAISIALLSIATLIVALIVPPEGYISVFDTLASILGIAVGILGIIGAYKQVRVYLAIATAVSALALGFAFVAFAFMVNGVMANRFWQDLPTHSTIYIYTLVSITVSTVNAALELTLFPIFIWNTLLAFRKFSKV